MTQTAYIITRKDFAAWVEILHRSFRLYGPSGKNRQDIAFQEIEKADDLVLDYSLTMLSPKKYLFPPTQTIFSFPKDKGYRIPEDDLNTRQIILGIHSCDLEAILRLDKVYAGQFHDPYYKRRRDNTLLIATSCTKPAENCFCCSVGIMPQPKTGFDILLTPLTKNSFLLEPTSSPGRGLVNLLKKEKIKIKPAKKSDFKSKEKKCRIACQAMKGISLFGLQELLEKNYEHPVWEKTARERCLGCGTCSLVCPTCYCFDVVDRLGFGTEEVFRDRNLIGCVLQDFAQVHAGNFRKDRTARLRQFVLHKLKHSVDQYGELHCVGCGRCMSWCIPNIDLREMVAEIRAGDAEVTNARE
jgi:ferredoxin